MWCRVLGLTGVLMLLASFSASAETKEEEAKRWATDLVKAKDAKTRAKAADELGKLGTVKRTLATPYTKDLLNALKDSDGKVRGAAANALGCIDPDDKKAVFDKIHDTLKAEKDTGAMQGLMQGLADVARLSNDEDLKKAALMTLRDLQKKATDKADAKRIQAVILTLTGGKK